MFFADSEEIKLKLSLDFIDALWGILYLPRHLWGTWDNGREDGPCVVDASLVCLQQWILQAVLGSSCLRGTGLNEDGGVDGTQGMTPGKPRPWPRHLMNGGVTHCLLMGHLSCSFCSRLTQTMEAPEFLKSNDLDFDYGRSEDPVPKTIMEMPVNSMQKITEDLNPLEKNFESCVIMYESNGNPIRPLPEVLEENVPAEPLKMFTHRYQNPAVNETLEFTIRQSNIIINSYLSSSPVSATSIQFMYIERALYCNNRFVSITYTSSCLSKLQILRAIYSSNFDSRLAWQSSLLMGSIFLMIFPP
ncbi:Protein CBG02190 [Caenorhabditis briggsae]|uniref:Protein CBG02190 n=1 Tax=Caenorhabditis briggsae TaxID=6238 RepID=A8WS51_CAEBR|nr:Protein CBG02190 [Caenorhabditis briggsae]CAP23309.1 Protein CBG02190 [Caenorhabditis briggsae]